MQKTSPLSSVVPERDETTSSIAQAVSPERQATVWVSRLTGIVGAICLFAALSVWLWRPGHWRLVLAFLTIAMFAAILHSYTFEDPT